MCWHMGRNINTRAQGEVLWQSDVGLFRSLKNWSNRRQARLVGTRSSRGDMLTKKNLWDLVEHILDHQCAEGDGELKLWCREQGSKFQDLSHKKNLARARARARRRSRPGGRSPYA